MSRITPESFTDKDAAVLPPRTIGTECEYSPQGLEIEGQTEAEAAGAIIASSKLRQAGVAAHGQYVGVRGGAGRIYADMLRFVELAPGERMGPAAAAVADIDGVEIMQKIGLHSGNRLEGLYRVAGTFIEQGYVDDPGKTSGYHESYIVPRVVAGSPLLKRVVASQLATRIYAMSGTIRRGVFVYSQKVWGIGGEPIERTVNRRTVHGQKPMLLIPPAASDADTIGDPDFARAEVRFADPVQSLVASYAGKAAASLAMRIVEQQGMFTADELVKVSLINPVAAAKRYAADLTLRRTAPVIGGMRMSALDLQEAQLDLARKLDQNVELPTDEHEAIDVIQFLVDALRRSRPDRVEYSRDAVMYIDFAARHRYIVTRSKDSISAMALNLQWDCILPVGPGTNYWAKRNEQEPRAQRVRELGERNGLAPTALARVAIIDSDKPVGKVMSWTTYLNAEGRICSFGSPYGD